MPKNQFRTPPVDKANEREHRRDLARAIEGLLRGLRNGTGNVTLTALTTTTEIEDTNITPDTVAILVPLTLTAAAAQATTYQTANAGSITLHHASAASVDREFAFVLFG